MRRAGSLLALAACALAGCGGATAAVPRPLGPLRWAPPALHDPTTIVLGDGYTETRLYPRHDYIVQLPPHPKRGGVTLLGGHNVVLIGGEISVPARTPRGRENDRYRRALYIKGASGTVHVEGVRFDAEAGAQWDAVDIAAPAAVVQLENLRIDGVRGGVDDFHADVVQPWGGVGALRIDRLTASSNYQGLTIPIDTGPIGSARIDHANLRGLAAGAQGNGHLLWLTTGSQTCRSYPVQLSDVWVRPRAGVSLAHTVWPQRRRPGPCAVRARGRAVSWPGLRGVHGSVRAGTPPHGDFVPRSVAGVGYVTPGYRR